MKFQNIKKFQNGFKEFINKGDILKLAIAFIMGQLFTKVISSLSNDIIMPPINLLLNENSIKDWKFQLKNSIYINYGNFIQISFEFLLVSLIIYTILIFVQQKLIKKNDTNQKTNPPKAEIYTKLESLEKEQIETLKEIKNILDKKLK
ncbi:MAG: large conductance mechanosensitive channel protein MscL [Phytoplasma sp.]|uniref:large conductance mechanosensitive channel protein MscL n=1 Tax=Phytoplasma sp. TaxID=2155 RepID=UPI002B40674E|nr:large conductance mechanosensitive channel protein MscL [Phytoplasma sp.]WRH06875.1 MAG: large conductance mechanosensitive channel protein MscL [Phytoplasma sp.]